MTQLLVSSKHYYNVQVPLIALAVGSRGLISQLLGPKFGGFLVYGSLAEKPIQGMPTLFSLRHVYKLEHINAETKVFGLISNPAGHSKGPILHNPAFRYTGYNGIYVPMQVDDIREFFTTYTSNDFAGFRYTPFSFLCLPSYEFMLIYLLHLWFFFIASESHTRKQQSAAVMKFIHWLR